MFLVALVLGACAADPQTSTIGRSTEGNEGTNYDQMIRIGDAARESGDMRTAVGVYRRALQVNPTPEVHVRLGDTLSDLGAYNEAIDVYEDGLDRLRNSPEEMRAPALRGIGNALLGLGQAEMALEPLNAARGYLPDDHRIRNSLGVAYDMLGRHSEAQDMYREALAISSASNAVRNNLGLSLALSGNYNEAIEYLRPLVHSSSATTRNRLNLALVYGLAGETAMATRVSRVDLDDDAIRSNLNYYASLRSLPLAQRSLAIRSNSDYFPQAVPAPRPVVREKGK
jgi:Flp pilus assembly protein TadD